MGNEAILIAFGEANKAKSDFVVANVLKRQFLY